MASQTPTYRYIDQIYEVNQAEWDCVISFGFGAEHFAARLDVLSFGNGSLGNPHGLSLGLSLQGHVVGDVLEVPPDLPPALEALVDRTLVPLSKGRGGYTVFSRADYHSAYAPSEVRPFLRTPHGAILAGSFRRQGDDSEVWALPATAPLGPWLREAITAWNARSPERYPLRGAWREQDGWRTPRQRSAVRLVDSIRQRRQQLLQQLDQEEERATLELQVATTEADRYERLLLLTQGEDLVAVVKRALEALGFDVEDMDKVNPPGSRREDLRVRYPSKPDWVALVEVKGYTRGGGATSDLQQLGRWASLYGVENGSLPSASWYVVNVMTETDPDLRPQPLASTADDVRVFADSGGLVVDTRQLFQAIARELDPLIVAEALLTQTGQFILPT